MCPAGIDSDMLAGLCFTSASDLGPNTTSTLQMRKSRHGKVKCISGGAGLCPHASCSLSAVHTILRPLAQVPSASHGLIFPPPSAGVSVSSSCVTRTPEMGGELKQQTLTAQSSGTSEVRDQDTSRFSVW